MEKETLISLVFIYLSYIFIYFSIQYYLLSFYFMEMPLLHTEYIIYFGLFCIPLLQNLNHVKTNKRVLSCIFYKILFRSLLLEFNSNNKSLSVIHNPGGIIRINRIPLSVSTKPNCVALFAQ
jgi:hypothetical protein